MPSREKLAEFTAWCRKNVTGDEKGQAQIFLDRLFQAFGQPSCLDVGGATEFRLRKSDQDGGGTAFADYVWKPVVLIEMKKRGERLQCVPNTATFIQNPINRGLLITAEPPLRKYC